MSTTNKTTANDTNVDTFIASVSDVKRREDSKKTLRQPLARLSGQKPH